MFVLQTTSNKSKNFWSG